MIVTTTDLTKFGYREIKMAEELLRAWRMQGLPKDFDENEVTIVMNVYSGCVFLANNEYQAVMMNGDNLESFYNCPYCGHEGFLEDMEHGPEDEGCTRYLEGIKEGRTQ